MPDLNLYSRNQYVGRIRELVIYGRETDCHRLTGTVKRTSAEFPILDSARLSIGLTPESANAFIPDIFHSVASGVSFRGTVYHTCPETCDSCEGGWYFECSAGVEGWIECEKCNGTYVQQGPRSIPADELPPGLSLKDIPNA